MARSVAHASRRDRPVEPVVEAAGGVVVRMSPRWAVQVAVVHRPGREDWSLPKGKRDPGESIEECALREVWEETGMRCRMGRFLDSVSYRDRRDRPKTVWYWLMEPVTGAFRPSDEVDELRWVGLDEAGGLLTYTRDVDLLEQVESALFVPSP